MKTYCLVITILLAIFIGYQAISYVVENRDLPQEIAMFDDIKGQPRVYRLSYSKNGDLTFATVKLLSSMPSITHWDYYGSTEVMSYKWINENTILIEMDDSTIKIVVPEFTATAK